MFKTYEFLDKRIFHIVLWKVQYCFVICGNSYTPVAFRKMSFLERGWNSVFVTFDIIKSHSFSEKFIEIPQVVQKIWRFSPSMLTVFINFSYYWHFLVTKNLMTSAYNTRCQQFFCFQSTLNRLFNNCVKLY